MSEPAPPPREYSVAEMAALRSISRKVWNQSFVVGRGPAWFAGGNWWPEELRRRAVAARAEADVLEVAADAMEREIKRVAVPRRQIMDEDEVVHRADQSDGEARPLCVIGEYRGHLGLCQVEV